jgi:hypothetical protein
MRCIGIRLMAGPGGLLQQLTRAEPQEQPKALASSHLPSRGAPGFQASFSLEFGLLPGRLPISAKFMEKSGRFRKLGSAPTSRQYTYSYLDQAKREIDRVGEIEPL